MITFFIKHFGLDGLSGVQFHMMDLALLLREEYGIDVCEVCSARDVVERFKTTGSRYIKMVPLVNKGSSILVTEMNAITWQFITHKEQFFDDYAHILILASNSMHHNYERCLSLNPEKTKEVFGRATIIEDRRVPHTLNLKMPTICVDRGIYTGCWKEFREQESPLQKFWFRYTRPDQYGGRELPNILQQIPQHMAYQTKRTHNPERVYRGLIYTRYYDYMPRLPFEFWFVGKPVYFADVSNGIENFLLQNNSHLNKDMLLHKEFVLDRRDFPRWEVSNLLQYFHGIGVI